MRRKLTKLLLLVVGLLVGVSAMAQKDVTKQYITNATLSSLDGWNNKNFNTPVNGYHRDDDNSIYSNATTGYASECYEGWSSVEKSEYYLTQIITLPAGHYTLVNYSFFREGANYNTDASISRAYLKAGNNQVPVKTLGSISANSYANSQWEAADCFDSKMYRNTLDFTISSDNTQIEIGVYGTFNTEITKSWMILGQFELIAKDIPATVDAPFDVTGYITNPGFEYRDLTGWTMSPEGSFGIQNNDQAFKAGWYYAEKWQSASNGPLTARSFSQTVTNLPAGLYKLTANVGGDGTYIKLNDKTTNGSSETADLSAFSAIETGQSLTITAGKTAEGSANWIHFDNFRLQFCGDVAATLASLIKQAENIMAILPSTADAKTGLETAITNAQAATDADALLQAIDNVTAAITTYKAGISSQKIYLYNVGAGMYLTSGNNWGTHAALDDDGMPITASLDEDMNLTLSTASAFSGKFVEGVWMDAGNATKWITTRVDGTDYFTLQNGSNKLYYESDNNVEQSASATGDVTYWKALTKDSLIARMATATKDSPVDATFFMTNGKVRRNWPKSIEGTGLSDNGSFNADKKGLYNGGCTSYGQYRKTFDNYQSLTGLPNGIYTVSVKGQYRETSGYAVPYLYANSQKSNLKVKGDIGGDNATNATKSLVDDTYLVDPVTVVIADGNLKVGVKSDTNVDWCTWREFTIKYLGTDVTADLVNSFVLPEGAMNADVQTDLNNAKTTALSELTVESAAALLDAITAADASIAAYANAAKWLPVNKAELESTNFVDPAVYEAKITDAETALADGTMTDEWANSITNITGLTNKSANYIDDILLTPWTIDGEQAKDYDQSLYINTWSTEFDEEDPNFKVPYFEYWTGDANSLGEKTLSGTIDNLEPGDYAVTALVRVRTKNGANTEPSGIVMAVNDGEGVAIEGKKIGNTQMYLQKASAFGTVGEDGKLTVTFAVNEDNNISWLAFKNVNYVKGAASIADFKATEEPTLLNLNGTEAFFVDDEGITYIQDANANVGLAIKGYDIDFTEEKQILSGQLFGTASGDTIIVDKDYESNSVIVSEGKATPKTLTPAEAALAESTFLLANIEQVEITEEEEVKYAEAEDGKVEIDNRLCEDLVVNTGDVLNMLAGITFLNEEGTNSVIAPRVQDDVVPVLWKAPSGITVGDAVTESEPIDLTTEDVQARMANLKAGDALNIAVEAPADANIIVKNENGVIYTIPVAAQSTNVEVPVTAFMEKDFQNHGVKIFADSEDLKAKYVTVRNAKYPDTENSIWLGEGNDVTLGKQHFGDVREGDMLEAEGEETVMAIGEEEIENGELTEDQAASVQEQGLTVTGATKVTFTLGDDMRLDITDNEEGESFNQGDKDLSVEGMIMTYGGNDPEGAVYEYAEAYPAANNFKTVTDGIDQFPVDNEDKAYNKDDKNLPTKGTFYVFEPTKDGQIEATVGVEGGKTIIVTEEGEAIVEEKKDADFEGPITFPVEATKTYYLFANDTNLKLFGFKFTPNDPNAENTVKDIETFKLLSANSIDGDTLLLKDAVVNYIHGDDVFVEDASGAIDFYRTQIQYYVGQVLNGYIIGSNDIVENMPVLLRTDGTKYGQFKVTDKVTPKATPATVADVTKDENLARFMKLEYVEVQRNERGFKMLVDPETQESVLVEDHFGVFYELGDLMESIEGIVGKNSEGEFAFWPTSKEGTVISDGFKQMVETELDVTNKDVAKSKNNPVVGISVTLDGACNAGSGSSMAGAMTSKGYKLRTANGSPDKNSAKFTVNDNQKVFDMTINAVANYAAKDTEKPCITVTKVEVDGKEVSFEGGEFPAKGASDCGSLILKGINAEKDIVIYFDNSNAEGTQLNMAYAITCRGEKVYTQKEKDLMAEAKKLAEDREAVAVGCLDDAIEAAEAGNTNGLQAAIDQFIADNTTSSVDYTDKVGKAVANWVNVQNCPSGEFKIYSGNGVNLVQVFGVTGEGPVLSQEVSGLDNGTYNIGLYATSHNAWDGKYGENKAGKPTLQEDDGSVAYVYGTSGDNTVKTWIIARRNSALTANEPELYKVNGVKVENGKLTVGLALAEKAKTEWHSIQIGYLRMETTAKEAYAAEKAKLVALLEEAEELLDGDQIGGKAKLQEAVDEANEAKESIRLNIDGMAAEVAKLQKAIEKFHAAGKVFVQNVATGKYLAAGANWGTHAVLNNTGLDYDIKKLEDGTMTFDSQVSNGGDSHYLNGEYVDGAAFGWTVEQLSNGNYTIYNGEKYLTAGDNDLVVLGDNADEWRFITVDERKETLAAATSSAPVDATFLVKGANYGRNDQRIATAWQVSKDCTNKNLSGGEDKNGAVGNNCAESYHSTFTISQLVEDAPAGTYVVTAQGFYRQDGGEAEDAPVYFANDEKQEIGLLTGTENSMTDAGISFKSGLYPLQSITVVVEENGTLTIGVQGTATSQWVIWDNFQLMYYGVGGEPTTKINEVKEVAEPAAVRNSFEDGAIYNLRGQKMEGTLKPGLYIKNGRKFVVK